MDVDSESLVLPALQRCVDELTAAAGDLSPEQQAALVVRIADHLRPALSLPSESEAGLLVRRLWNLPLQEQLGEVTARLCRRLAADLLMMTAPAPAERRPLPVEGATQVLLTAARESVAAGELARALSALQLAQRDLLVRRASAQAQLATFSRRADVLRQLSELEQARFACLMVRAEALFLRRDAAGADEAVREAGGARDASVEQLQYMQRLLFNFGLQEYRQQDWAEAIRWITSSMQIGQQLARSRCPADLRARTLDLLARSHLQAGSAADLSRALELLQLAFSESPCLTLRLLTLVCELRRSADEETCPEALSHCVRDATDWCRGAADFVQVADVLERHGRREQALAVLRGAPGAESAVCRRSVRLLLSLNRPEEALQAVAAFCGGAEEGPVPELVAALESRAAALTEDGQLAAAAEMLQSLANLPALEPSVAGRLLRNLARCRRRQGELGQAEAALCRSLQLQSGHPSALYMLLQQQIAADDADSALSLVPLIEKSDDRAAAARLWRNLCGFALGRQMSGLYERLLEVVLRHLDSPEEAVPLAQCLLRSRIEALESGGTEAATPGPLIAALESTLLILQKLQQGASGSAAEAVAWFADVAWNVAADGQLAPEDRCRLFTLCRLILETIGPAQEPARLSLCRTSALMAAAAALEAARQPAVETARRLAHLREAADAAEECDRLSARLGGAAGWAHQTTLLLYQFEAKAGLDAPELEALLDAALTRPDLDAVAMETLAALSGDRPALVARALRAAAQRLLSVTPTDWERVASLQSRYISLMLDHAEAPGLAAEEVLRAVLGVRDVIRRADGRYPNMATLFMMTRTWNHAVRRSACGETQQANRWAAAARGLVSLLAAQNEWYRHRTRQLPGPDGQLPPATATAQ